MDKGAAFDLFTVLGHDLKFPLNAVEQYLQIIRDKMLGEGVDPYLDIGERSLARLNQMRELITDATDWAKIQSPATPRAISVVDLSAAARAVLDGYQREERKRDTAMSSEIEDNLTMRALAWEIDLMLRHLIGNAIRSNREGGYGHLPHAKGGHPGKCKRLGHRDRHELRGTDPAFSGNSGASKPRHPIH